MNIALLFVIWANLHSLAFAGFTKPIPPSKDAFYELPKDLDKFKPGEIIRYRQSPQKLKGFIVPMNIENQWQFLVRTTDSFGNPTAIVTSLLQPYNADPKKVLSYQFAQDSPNIDCSPSYSILHKSSPKTLLLQLELGNVGLALSKGWYVVAPDYEGPNSTFTLARIAGWSTLDSIRAILQTEGITGIDPNAKVALWGYSGGTVPTSWAAVLQPKYAPELGKNLVGAVFGGWLTNLTDAAIALDGGYMAGLIPLAVNGLLNAHPELIEEVLPWIKDDYERERIINARDFCLIQSLPEFAFNEFFKGEDPIFSNGQDVLKLPNIKAVNERNNIGIRKEDGVPEIPLFSHVGMKDSVIPFQQTDRGFAKLCEFGVASFEVTVSETTGHLGEMSQGPVAVLKWISDRFDGVPPVKGCVRTVRNSNIDYPGADTSVYQIFRASVESILGKELGLYSDSFNPKAAEFSYTVLRKLVDALPPSPI